MLSKDKELSSSTLSNNKSSQMLNETNKKSSDIIMNSNKLYDINDDYFNLSNTSGLTLSTLKKFKTFKEYKEFLEKGTVSPKKTKEKKKELINDKIESNKKIDLTMKKNPNLKLESLDKKYISSKKNLLQDLQNTREKFIKDKHKSFQKLHIPSFGYPNIKRVTRSTSILVPNSKSNTLKPKNSHSDITESSNYIESLKNEALSLAERMKKIDENASEDIIKRFKKITNNSIKSKPYKNINDNKNNKSLNTIKTKKVENNEKVDKEIKTNNKNENKTKNKNEKEIEKSKDKKENNNSSKEITKNEANKNEANKNETNKNETNKNETNKNDLDKKTDNEKISNNENDKGKIKEKVKVKEIDIEKGKEKENKNSLTNKSSDYEIPDGNENKFEKLQEINNINIKELYSNKIKIEYSDFNTSKEEDMNKIINNLRENSVSPITFSKNISEKTKQIREKRRKEKNKVFEKLNEMKKIQQERIQMIEKESSEWKNTITDIEKQLALLKNSISSTDGLFTNLYKKGKELELEIDNIKKKNIEFEKSHHKHISFDDIEETKDDKINSTEKYEYFNETLYDDNLAPPIVENDNNTKTNTNNNNNSTKSDNNNINKSTV